MIITYLIIFFTGAVVSFISTLFGLGGGIIMVPILSLFLPYSHIEAVATSLAAIIFVAGFNTYNFYKKDVIVWEIVPWIAITASLFAFISAWAAPYLSEKILIIIFILFLFWVAIRTFLISNKEGNINNSYSKWLPLGIGSLSGSISGFTGIGGGGITTPLILVTKLVKNIQAAPTSNAIMIFTTLFASFSFALPENIVNDTFVFGYVHLDTSVLLFVGSALFSRIGVKINFKIPIFWRKTVLGSLLLFICIRFLFMLISE